METLRMSAKERRRLEVLSRVKSRELSLASVPRIFACCWLIGWPQ